MTLTGRAALAALIGGLAVLAFRTGLVLLIVNALIVAGIAADLILAANVRQLRATRAGDTKIHLGQAGTVMLTIANTGRRTLRGVVRDAWRPSAAALPARIAVRVPAGGQATAATTLTPQRRGDAAAGKVTVRSLGPFGLAGRQPSLPGPWPARGLPPFPRPK